MQKEHSNIIPQLRATNETMLSPENIPASNEAKDDGSGENGFGARQRKKIERNTSAPLPGMLQVSAGVYTQWNLYVKTTQYTSKRWSLWTGGLIYGIDGLLSRFCLCMHHWMKR